METRQVRQNRRHNRRGGKRWNAVHTLIIGFGALILIGALCLMLPIASRNGHHLSFLDALFTSTSASCVTGLVLYDTATQFTGFGQLVILCLIQIGGLGFMTLSILVSILLHHRIGLHRRAVLMDTIGALQVGGVVRLTRRALIITGCFEGIGALLLSFWFCPRYGLKSGIWMAIFHAISAYCNAGFDLLGTGQSLISVAEEPLINLVLMIEILAGGLGFLIWDDIISHKLSWKKYRLHSKIVLLCTGIFFVLGTILFLLIEQGPDGSLSGKSFGTSLLIASFQSVTARTAGFNTINFSQLREGSVLLLLFLMFVGAGSGSTGGGLKVNTFAVLFLCTIAQVRRQKDVNLFHRRLDDESIRKAFSSLTLYTLLCLSGCMVLCLQDVAIKQALFESISAIGTVGLSLSLTPMLPMASRITMILLMFAGRVGSMSVAMAITGDDLPAKLRNIPEKILIG